MKFYPLAQETISKKEITLLSKWLLKGEKLKKIKLLLSLKKNFQNILIENIQYL